MDDCLVYGPAGPVMVASMDLCVAGIQYRRALHRPECSTGRHLPHHLPHRRSNQLRTLWKPVACVQPGCHGLVRLERICGI